MRFEFATNNKTKPTLSASSLSNRATSNSASQLSVCGRHTDISSINNLLSLPFEYKLKRSVACRFWCVFCLSKWLSNGYPRRLCQTKTRELTGVAKRGQGVRDCLIYVGSAFARLYPSYFTNHKWKNTQHKIAS